MSHVRLPVCLLLTYKNIKFVVVQILSHVWLFATPYSVAPQASLSCTISWSLLKLISIESVMPSNHLILLCPLLLLPSIFPSIRIFSNKSVLRIYIYGCIHTAGCLLFSLKKKGNADTYYNMVEPWGHYAEWKDDSSMIPLMWDS